MGGRCPYVTGTVVACSGSSASYMIDNGSARWVVHLDSLKQKVSSGFKACMCESSRAYRRR